MKKAPAKRVKHPRISEKSVESAIRTILELNGWRTHKLEVFAGIDVIYNHGGKSSTRTYSEGDIGQADLIAVRPAPRLALLYIENKAKDGKMSPEQKAWRAVREREGFTVVCPRSPEDCWEQMRAAGIEPMRVVCGGGEVR